MSLYHYGLVVTDAVSGVWLSLLTPSLAMLNSIRHLEGWFFSARFIITAWILLCSVWSNGKTGWGLKVPGGTEVRRRYFGRSHAKIALELDGIEVLVNIAKKSF